MRQPIRFKRFADDPAMNDKSRVNKLSKNVHCFKGMMKICQGLLASYNLRISDVKSMLRASPTRKALKKPWITWSKRWQWLKQWTDMMVVSTTNNCNYSTVIWVTCDWARGDGLTHDRVQLSIAASNLLSITSTLFEVNETVLITHEKLTKIWTIVATSRKWSQVI